MSEICPTLFSSHVSALPNPHTPRGVGLGRAFCLACRTVAQPRLGKLGTAGAGWKSTSIRKINP
jgi:hypothetical protein